MNHQLIFPDEVSLDKVLKIFSVWLNPQGIPVFIFPVIPSVQSFTPTLEPSSKIAKNIRQIFRREDPKVDQSANVPTGPALRLQSNPGIFIKKSNLSKTRNLLFKSRIDIDGSPSSVVNHRSDKKSEAIGSLKDTEIEELDFRKVMEEAQRMIGVSNWQRTESARKRSRARQSAAPGSIESVNESRSSDKRKQGVRRNGKCSIEQGCDSDSESSSEIMIKRPANINPVDPSPFKIVTRRSINPNSPTKTHPIKLKLERKLTLARPTNPSSYLTEDLDQNSPLNSLFRTHLKRFHIKSQNSPTNQDSGLRVNSPTASDMDANKIQSSQNIRRKLSVNRSRLTTCSNPIELPADNRFDGNNPTAARRKEKPLIFTPISSINIQQGFTSQKSLKYGTFLK